VRLAGEIARSLADIGRVAVEGEVYRPQTYRGGRTYFTLRDRAAQMPVSFAARAARRCRAVDGERVLVVGALVWGNDRGQLVLEADEVVPIGEGAVAAMIAETRARLAVEGLLDRPRRRVPLLPRVIGVLCGSEAAVRKDIESVVAARFPGYPLDVEETTVSGPGAAWSIVDALRRLSDRPEVDVVVLARGGGDATALLPWSDEELCRAIAACRVPVVSAIGHESDRPLCDEVADLRCGTPSIAAHTVVPDRRQLEAELTGLRTAAARNLDRRREMGGERLARVEVSGALAAGFQRASSRLRYAGDRLVWAYPGPGVQSCRRRLDSCDWRRPMAAQVQSSRGRAEALGRHARSLSPQHVIERGFAVVRRLDGVVVRGPDEVGPGEVVDLTVARGNIFARVEDGGRARDGGAEGWR
jgi:exodeoxyribonuclease VII large subunit